jgi:hypothetical protein
MKHRIAALVTAILACTAVPARAQNEHLKVTISDAGAARQIDANWKFGATLPTDDPLVLAVECDSHTDCSTVRVQTVVEGQGRSDWTASPNPTAARATFTTTQATLNMKAAPAVLISIGAESPIAVPVAVPDPPSTATAVRSTLTGREFLPCDTRVAHGPLGRNEVVYVVTPTGSVVARSAPFIDEDDQLMVYVQGHPDIVSRIHVERESAFREVGGFPLVGMDVTIDPSLVRQSAGGDKCVMTGAPLENFAGSAAGKVKISLMTPKRNAPDSDPPKEFEMKAVGGFELPVHRLYRGAFSFGLMRTELPNPAYAVPEGDSVLVETGAGRRYLYTLLFTPFIWGARDVESWSLARLPQYINPSIGAVVNEIGKNGVAGLTLELPAGIFLTAGLHTGRVTRPAPGLQTGAVVPGTRRKAPSEERWETETFSSLSVDLRAAARFLSRLGTGGS